ncbi:MAG: hypothetical protein Q8O85_14490, partial [Rhodoferax sp.]|uniref:hypothetical protein n=1 Tax=Rhodoferax sp. TaxID=50421 RepID=UPI0027354CE1
TTQLAPASKEKQRRQGAPGRLNRVRSALTQRVNLIGAKKFNLFHDLIEIPKRSTAESRFNPAGHADSAASGGGAQDDTEHYA